ncbi:diguanylate cyclase domain-containing protein [Kineococcus sp. SYSU DK002]|uniref:diguanylate cyclase domain-containing protein n=1 Tax=Kineococcus sp. SYSU DK002 TaxID=3383123 RepID=UPI003D7DFF61
MTALPSARPSGTAPRPRATDRPGAAVETAEAIALLDADGALVHAGPGFTRLLGPGATDLPAADALRSLAAGDAAGDLDLDVETVRADGTPRTLRVRASAVPGGGALLHLRDVGAERAEAAELAALRTRLAQLAAVVDASPDTIYRIHLGRGRVEWTNTGGASLLGLPSAHDAVGLDVVHPDDRPGVERAVRSLREAAPGEIVECTYRVVTGAAERWVHTRSTVTDRDRHGRAEQVVGIAQDLTETITTMDALAGSERRFHEVFARGPVGMLLFSLEGWISEVNEALCTFLGRDAAELVGAPAAELLDPDGPDPAGPREGAAPLAAQQEALLAGTAEVVHREHRYELPDGRAAWAQVTLSLTSSSTGEPAFLAFVEDITARKREAEQLEHAALHDPLTGLPNRAKVEDRLRTALARTQRLGGGCAVLFVDLDHFKDVNDSLGHAAGDDLLRDVADRLRGLLRAGDTAARLGGDEFVLVCEDVADAQALAAIADRVCERITIPVDLGQRTVTVTASVGAARTTGTVSAAELMRDADHAMYRAKAAGRSCWRVA